MGGQSAKVLRNALVCKSFYPRKFSAIQYLCYLSSGKQNGSEISLSPKTGGSVRRGGREGRKGGGDKGRRRGRGGAGIEKETRRGLQGEKKDGRGGKKGESKIEPPKEEEVKLDDTLSNHHKLLMSWEPDYPRGLQATRAPILFAIENMEDKLKEITGRIYI